MGRYSNTPILKDDNGVRYYDTSLYPLPTPLSDDIYVITQRGDRLDLLAHQYYGDSTLWWILASVNNLPTDSIYPPAGQQLRIISNSSNFIQQFTQLNSSR